MVILAASVFAAISLIGCTHLIKDETNFTRPELKLYRKIVVLPFGPEGAHVDTYYAQALDRHWPKVMIVPPDMVLRRFHHEDVRSFQKAHHSLEEIGSEFGADAVIEGIIDTHSLAQLNRNDSRAAYAVHLTVYMMDLKTSEAVACFHSSEIIQVQSPLYYTGEATPYHGQSRKIAMGNALGLIRLAQAAGHL